VNAQSRPRAQRGTRIVSTVECLRSPAPRLVDFHMVREDSEPTAELPLDESMWETVSEDRGGCRAGRVGADVTRAARR
jgi:hypothetical protein